MTTHICTICKTPIEDGVLMGDGDGTGQRFAHPACWYRRDYERLKRTLQVLDSMIADHGFAPQGTIRRTILEALAVSR